MTEQYIADERSEEETYRALAEAAFNLGFELDADRLGLLEVEYDVWADTGVFVSLEGVFLNRVDEEEEGFPSLTIPEEFGYVESEDDYAIHSVPPHYRKDEEGKIIEDEANEPQKDQKYSMIQNGLKGSFAYLFLVDAGLIPKPKHILGVTNPTMAKFAQRAGLKSAEVMEILPTVIKLAACQGPFSSDTFVNAKRLVAQTV